MPQAQNTQLAVFSTGGKRELKRVPIYSPEKGEVLVRNVAVASNPKDWKYPVYNLQWAGSEWSAVEGSDVAGYVEEVGEGVTNFKKGDKVAGFTVMIAHSKYGGYQEYTIVPATTLFPLPPGCTFEEASTYPLAFMTAALGLFQQLKLPTPLNPVLPEDTFPIIVWGASSSVGAFAVQLAKASGLQVIGVAGSASDYVREIGADDVVDYRNKSSSEIVSALNSALGGKGATVRAVYDAISESSSVETIVQFLSEKKENSKFVTVLRTPVELPADGHVARLITYVKAVHHDTPFESFGGVQFEPGVDFGREWYAWLGREGKNKVKPNRVKVIPGGLEGVDEGLTLLEKGKVSGEKLVYRIADTKALSQEQ
ncbi:GroES-like protein [Atractiella rhizophila]|nr:GroES-like protein [Atractiella rhizophila]